MTWSMAVALANHLGAPSWFDHQNVPSTHQQKAQFGVGMGGGGV